MRHAIATTLLGLLCSAASQPQDPAPASGSVTGTITLATKLALRGTASQRDLIVYLEPKQPAANLPAPTPATVSQARLTFSPHVLPVQRGAKVTFRNDDAVTHNVLVEAKCCATDTDTEKGTSRDVTFPEAGVYPVACRLHPEMAMHVVVLDTHWFVAVTLERQKPQPAEPAGESEPKSEPKTTPTFQATFTLADVPPGDYVLKTWNKRLPAFEQPITVVAGKATSVALTR